MIVINDTPKVDVIVAADKEVTYAQGLLDTISLLKESPDNISAVEGYISRNAVLKGIEGDLKRAFSPRTTLIDAIASSATQIVMYGTQLRERITKSKTTVYDTETITFQERGVLDAISSINFFNRYAGIILNIVITQADKEVTLSKFMTKGDLTFLNNTAKYFTQLVVHFSASVKDLNGMIDDLPDEPYSVESESIVRGNQGPKALRGLAQYELNPMYWVKRYRMKKDLKNILSAEADIDMLAVKIARLNNRRNGTEDPGLERQIEVYEDAMVIAQGKIASIEARYPVSQSEAY